MRSVFLKKRGLLNLMFNFPLMSLHFFTAFVAVLSSALTNPFPKAFKKNQKKLKKNKTQTIIACAIFINITFKIRLSSIQEAPHESLALNLAQIGNLLAREIAEIGMPIFAIIIISTAIAITRKIISSIIY